MAATPHLAPELKLETETTESEICVRCIGRGLLRPARQRYTTSVLIPLLSTAGNYFRITPQAIRAPEFPDGSVL